MECLGGKLRLLLQLRRWWMLMACRVVEPGGAGSEQTAGVWRRRCFAPATAGCYWQGCGACCCSGDGRCQPWHWKQLQLRCCLDCTQECANAAGKGRQADTNTEDPAAVQDAFAELHPGGRLELQATAGAKAFAPVEPQPGEAVFGSLQSQTSPLHCHCALGTEYDQ